VAAPPELELETLVKPWDDIQVAHQDEWRAAVATLRERRGAPEPE
jgi:hypothetical protein